MRSPNDKSPAELLDDFIKLQWQDHFRTDVMKSQSEALNGNRVPTR